MHDFVWLRLQPYQQSSVARRPSKKLAKLFFGPYKILKRIGVVAYRVELPDGSHIHPVFHVSQLKPYVGSAGLPTLTPLVVVSSRVALQRGVPETQLLVQWKGLPPEATTWEPSGVFQESFPHFHLEDKVFSKAGGVDTIEGREEDIDGNG